MTGTLSATSSVKNTSRRPPKASSQDRSWSNLPTLMPKSAWETRPTSSTTNSSSTHKVRSYSTQVVSQAKPAPPRTPVKPQTSPNKPALNPSYSQIVKTSFTPRARDPGKLHMTTHDHQSPSISRVTTRDPGNVSGDLPRDWSPT